MANLSLRGLDDAVLVALKARAARENASVNSLVLQLIDQALGRQRARPARLRHGDLDALAGSWGAAEAKEFESAAAAQSRIDAELWK